MDKPKTRRVSALCKDLELAISSLRGFISDPEASRQVDHGTRRDADGLCLERIFDSNPFDNLSVVQVFTHKNFRPALICRADDHGVPE